MFGFTIKHYKVTHFESRPKKVIFISLKSLAEDEDVIDCVFYNIFLGVDFTGEVTFEDLHGSWFAVSKCSFDTPNVAVNF